MTYIEELFSLENMVAVITGGGGVIPGTIAEAFLKAGARVSLWGWREESLHLTSERLNQKYNRKEDIHICVVDTGIEERVSQALNNTVKDFGLPHILVNGVGGVRGKSDFIGIDLKLFDDVLKLNLIAGLVIPSKIFGKFWIEQKIKASIINIASMSSYIPLSGVWAYDAAKAAVLNLTMGLAREFAPYGIRVNAIAPGFFLGKQNRALLIDEKTGELTERGKAVVAHTPFGRFGNPEELEGVVIFLASERASGFVTGVCIPIDGGYLVHNI
ncbi:MAG: SDR family oxidoreductase [Spirochaetota bacterium]